MSGVINTVRVFLAISIYLEDNKHADQLLTGDVHTKLGLRIQHPLTPTVATDVTEWPLLHLKTDSKSENKKTKL